MSKILPSRIYLQMYMYRNKYTEKRNNMEVPSNFPAAQGQGVGGREMESKLGTLLSDMASIHPV